MSDRPAQPRRANLQLVPATREDVRRHLWFCDACGAHAEAGVTPAPFDRRCRVCDGGQLLEAAEPLAPAAGDAFLTFDDRLLVTSCSDAAAELLATAAAAVGQRLDRLLCAPEAQGDGASLAPRLLAALADDGAPTELTARPAGVFGVRLRLRAGVCGPPRRGVVVISCNGASRAGSGELPARERRGRDARGRRLTAAAGPPPAGADALARLAAQTPLEPAPRPGGVSR